MNTFYLSIYENMASFLSDTGQEVEIFKSYPDLYKEMYRIGVYRKCWDAYSNAGFIRRDPKTSKAVKVNIAKAFVDRSTDFLLGNMFTVYPHEKAARLMMPVITSLNEKAGMPVFALEVVINGSVFGDSFVKLIWDEEIKSVRFQLLDGEKVFVKYKKTSKSRSEMEYAVICYFGEYTGEDGILRNVLYKEKWTASEYELAIEWIEKRKESMWETMTTSMINRVENRPTDQRDYQTKVIETKPNSLGFIPIVHFRNQVVPLSDYGRGDVVDLIDLNKSLNEISTQYMDNAEYHGSPIMAIFGAKVGNLKRGANKVWSGLPKDAKIETVGGKTDFPALKSMMEILMDYAYLVGGIPEASSGLFQNISNTTGVALQVQYLPLIGLTKRKRLAYGAGFKQLYEYSLKMLDTQRKLGLQARVDRFKASYMALEAVERELRKTEADATPTKSDDLELAMDDMVREMEEEVEEVNFWEVEIKWSDYLPKDSLQELQEMQIEMELGIESKRGAMKRRGVEDIDRKIEEIEAEQSAAAEQFAMPTYGNIDEFNQTGIPVDGEGEAQSTAQQDFSDTKSEEQKSPEVSGGRV